MFYVIPSVPGPVNITVSKVDNDNRVIVSWSLPNPLNGVISQYTVKYRKNDSQIDITLNTNESKIEISGLDEYKHVNNLYLCMYLYLHLCT